MTQTIINTPGTGAFTVPSGVTSIVVELWGGGGGSSGSIFLTLASGGGGGGGYVEKTLFVSGGDVINYTVGIGGAAGGAGGGSGGFGGATTISPSLMASGGGGSGAGSGGTGGGASGGDINTIGSHGGNGGGMSVSSLGGSGGSSPNGGGTQLGTTGAGQVGNAPGGGASGNGGAVTDVPGEIGANGQIVFTYTVPIIIIINGGGGGGGGGGINFGGSGGCISPGVCDIIVNSIKVFGGGGGSGGTSTSTSSGGGGGGGFAFIESPEGGAFLNYSVAAPGGAAGSAGGGNGGVGSDIIVTFGAFSMSANGGTGGIGSTGGGAGGIGGTASVTIPSGSSAGSLALTGANGTAGSSDGGNGGASGGAGGQGGGGTRTGTTSVGQTGNCPGGGASGNGIGAGNVPGLPGCGPQIFISYIPGSLIGNNPVLENRMFPNEWIPGINLQHEDARGLQLALPLSERSGTLVQDLSPNKINGTATGSNWRIGSNTDIDEFFGWRYWNSSDASSYALFPYNASTDIGLMTQGSTVSLWIRPYNPLTTADMRPVLSTFRNDGFGELSTSEGGALPGWVFSWQGNSTNQATFSFIQYLDSSFDNYSLTSPAYMFESVNNNWVHIARTTYAIDNIIYDNLYVNGIISATTLEPFGGDQAIQGGQGLVMGTILGHDGSDETLGYLGDIKDVRVYNRILTPGEITRLVNFPDELYAQPDLYPFFSCNINTGIVTINCTVILSGLVHMAYSASDVIVVSASIIAQDSVIYDGSATCIVTVRPNANPHIKWGGKVDINCVCTVNAIGNSGIIAQLHCQSTIIASVSLVHISSSSMHVAATIFAQSGRVNLGTAILLVRCSLNATIPFSWDASGGITVGTFPSFINYTTSQFPYVWLRLDESSGTMAINSGTAGSIENSAYIGDITLNAPGLIASDPTDTAVTLGGVSSYISIPDSIFINN